jgi:hypothetical protein
MWLSYGEYGLFLRAILRIAVHDSVEDTLVQQHGCLVSLFPIMERCSPSASIPGSRTNKEPESYILRFF